MQKYRYTARDERGKVVKGTMVALDDVDLSHKISGLGYFLTSFSETHEKDEVRPRAKMPRLKTQELLTFTIQLATLLEAGLPLLDGLRSLAQDADDERVQRIIDDIRFRLEGGTSLREILMFHSQSFPPLYTAIVGAGEVTGKLPQALHDLAKLLEWQMEIKSKIREAATYPIILFTVMVAVVVLLVVKVIPQFEPIFENVGAELPLPTQIVLNISHFIRGNWYIIILAIITLVVGCMMYSNTKNGHYQIDSLKLKLPLFGKLMRKTVLSRFIHTFALCFRSGIDLLSSLDIARQTCGNVRIEAAVSKAKEAVNAGERLVDSLRITGEFPAVVLRMVGVGEQSGTLGQSLSRVADFFDKQVADMIKKIFALVEPIMIVVMGVVVGGIALSVFLPLFRMADIVG